MTESDNEEKDVKQGIKEIDDVIIKNVLNYLKTGKFNNKTAESYIIAYTVVYKLADDENDSSSVLFKYYNDVITKYLKEICTNLLAEPQETLLEAFLRENEKIKILIHWMRKVFNYLDKFYTTQSKTGTLFENALKSFSVCLFFPLKNNIINSLNTIINDHRDGKAVDVMKIVRTLKVFKQVDLNNPILNKVGDEFEWSGNQKNTKGVLKDWFFSSFLISTELYANNKAKAEITALSAPEYVQSCLKFLKEEEERKSLFILREFHKHLDAVNNKYLIENNCKVLATVSLSKSF